MTDRGARKLLRSGIVRSNLHGGTVTVIADVTDDSGAMDTV